MTFVSVDLLIFLLLRLYSTSAEGDVMGNNSLENITVVMGRQEICMMILYVAMALTGFMQMLIVIL